MCYFLWLEGFFCLICGVLIPVLLLAEMIVCVQDANGDSKF